MRTRGGPAAVSGLRIAGSEPATDGDYPAGKARYAARREPEGLTAPEGRQADVAVVAVGDAGAYREALATLAPRGRLVLFSGLAPASAVQGIDLNALHYHEQTLVGAYGCSLRHGRQALDLIARGLPVADLITHRLALADLEHGLELVAQRQAMKVLLFPSQLTTKGIP